jgi:phosphohistidine phosphatase
MAEERLFYLIRHGVAEERGPGYPDDSRRPLTSEGKARLVEIGAGLVALGVDLDEILTSPFVRTRQTADILAQAWSKPPRVTDVEALAVGSRTGTVLAALASGAERPHVAIVGHMPGIGVLAAELIGASRPLDFRKGSVACIALDRTPRRGAGDLRWFVPPRLLRIIGRRRG